MARPPRQPTSDASLLDALRIPATGRLFDLALTLDNSSVQWPGHGPFAHYQWMTHAQGARLLGSRTHPSRVGMMSDRVELPLHAGTHIDALNHFSVDGRLFGGYQVADVEVPEGTEVLGIDTAPVLLCEGVLLDFVALKGAPLESGEVIDATRVEQALARQGLTSLPRQGVVLLHTGWMQQHYKTSRRTYFLTEPGIDVSAARLVADAGVAAVGADTSAVEAVPYDPASPYPVHQELIVRRGIYMLENVVTADLSASRTHRFLFIATPIKIRGGSGSPIRALAIS